MVIILITRETLRIKKDIILIYRINFYKEVIMNKNKSGHRIKAARFMCKPVLTQNDLMAKMQLKGIKISKNIMSRIELNERYVTDLELIAFSEILNVSTSWLLEETDIPNLR